MVASPLRLPVALEAAARWQRLGPAHTPVMLVHPDWDSGAAAPLVLWMHGRTASKEVDPGRYLRLMRAGVGVCAVDLPGHGERFEPALQQPERTLDVVLEMLAEIDGLIDALAEVEAFDLSRLGIGGMSAGGMAAIARLCTPHRFRCAAVEATSGSWIYQRHRAMFRGRSVDEIARIDPLSHLDDWREIPLLAQHARADEWVDVAGQTAFVEALRARARQPELVELVLYDKTGAPHEHIGFGRVSAEAKDRQRDFFRRWLVEAP